MHIDALERELEKERHNNSLITKDKRVSQSVYYVIILHCSASMAARKKVYTSR